MDPQEAAQRYQQLIDAGWSEADARAAVERWQARNGAPVSVTPSSPSARPPAPEEKAKTRWQDWLRVGAQGLTFGFGDEIESVLTGRNVDEIRSSMQTVRDAHPIAAFGLEMAGGAPYMALPGLGAGRAAQTMSVLQRAKSGARAGALAGAAYGAGTGEGAGTRLLGAAGGAAGGATFGFGLPVAGAFSSAVGRNFREGLLRAPLQGLDRMMDGRLPAFMTPATNDEIADRLVARALARDNITLDQAEKLATGAIPEERLADLMGGSTRRAARGAMAIPNAAYDEAEGALVARGQDEIARVSNILDDFFSVPDVNVDRVATELRRGMRDRAKEAYEAAYSASFRPSERLQAIVNAPGIRRLAREHRALVDQYGFDNLGIFSYEMAPNGQISVGPNMSVRSLDSLKRALDDAITVAYKNGEGTKAEGLSEIRRAILSELDESVPEYAAARAQYRGDLEVSAALQSGRDLGYRNVSRREVENALEEATSEAEREMLRLGWMSGLRERIQSRNPGSSIAQVEMGTQPTGAVRQNTREAFSLLFPDQNVDGFFQRLQRESGMRQTERFVLGGSPTARIQQEVTEATAGDPTVGAVAQGFRRGPSAGLSALADAAEQEKYSGVAEQIVRRTLLDDPTEVVNALRRGPDPAKIRRNLIWGDRLSGAAGVGSGLLSGRIAGTTASNFFR